ncbi:myeloid leukemia factor 1 isoform X2 [Indicator indicator]|uniref:myeloid leukemia factor 1 isoform X2 n=1 Tax=Indicator indicator TaxID=1002788 RepID=UPI0023DE758D|nr:myeloid leukemia factor 1 isoform X2 [Indicator indicator]
MFGSLGRCFEDDPFFRDPFAAHHEHMRQMMRSFSDPFGRDPFLSLPGGVESRAEWRAGPDTQLALRGGGRATSYSLMPFGGFGRLDADFGDPFFAMDRMMSKMRNSMLEMQRKFDDLSVHPDAHTFSSSSVMTYSRVGDEPPKVFQASAQTRTAPGGVKETRKALRDSESGVEKMAIGHHIKDRAHVIKKSKNSKTGDEEMNQEFINLDETEAQTFDEEWQKEIMKFKPSRSRGHLEAPKYSSIHHVPKEKPLAIKAAREPRASVESLNVRGTHLPLKSSKK